METFDERFLFSNFDTAEENDDEQNYAINLLRTANNKKKLGEDAKETSEKIDPQNKYISDLEQQNAKLKSIIKRMLGPQVFSQSEENVAATVNEDGEIDLIKKLEDDIQSKPFAVVLFLNNDVSTVHRKEIDEMMKMISTKKATQDVLMAQKLQAQNSAVPIKAFTANFKGRRFNPTKMMDGEDPFVVCACQYFKSFFIDRMGAPLLESNPSVTDIWDVPLYQQVFLKALPILEEALNVRVKQVKQCFNCGGEHLISECTLPKDMKRINAARQQFSANKMNSPSGYDARYHVTDEEIEERFKPFKAGEISVGLEEALNISLKSQVPPYIYKMRQIGYPPGWVKPADDAGLKMYGAEGNIIEEPGFEEGEIKPVKLPDVISYPGYNVPMPEGVKDEHRSFNMPPYDSELADLDIARKRAKYLGYGDAEPVAKRLKYDDEDMEVENQNNAAVNGKPPLPLIEVVGAAPLPPPPDDSTTDDQNEEEKPAKRNGKEEKEEKPKDNTDKDEADGATKTAPKTKQIDQTTYRNWYVHKPLSSVGITYVMYTPPPTCRGEVNLIDLPKNPIVDLDREPWKTASASWYDPLYGDLAAPTGTYDAIRTLLKETKRVKRKPMI